MSVFHAAIVMCSELSVAESLQYLAVSTPVLCVAVLCAAFGLARVGHRSRIIAGLFICFNLGTALLLSMVSFPLRDVGLETVIVFAVASCVGSGLVARGSGSDPVEVPIMENAPTQDVQISPIRAELVESFRRCLDSVARERRFLCFLEAPPLESCRAFITSNIANGVPQWVALHPGEVVGWCDVEPLAHEGFKHCGRLGMGVHKDSRGRGIGRRLIEQTLDHARQRGLERVELEVFASNAVAIRLYEQVGFVIEGTKRKVRKIDGVYEDVVCMALLT